jgi:hypothetical protein
MGVDGHPFPTVLHTATEGEAMKRMNRIALYLGFLAAAALFTFAASTGDAADRGRNVVSLSEHFAPPNSGYLCRQARPRGPREHSCLQASAHSTGK